MEEAVIIAGAEVSLEGRLLPGDGPGGVVITHPHPLFGGDMHNNVVVAAQKAGAARGWTALRFNFRGVGRSTGSFGGGLVETADVAAALDFLRARTPGPYYLVGYSFGAAVAARAMLQGLIADGLALLAPPIAFMDLTFLPTVPRLRLIVVGDQDELCPLADLRALLRDRRESPEGLHLKVLPGADHFFGGAEDQLFKILRDFPF